MDNEPTKPLSILYRGTLSSCNYDCEYCPFAKHVETVEELARDRLDLARFVNRAIELSDWELRILFTPWGEALVRSWYWEAFARLSHAPHITKVAAQTNLSCRLDWLDRCDVSKVALWCTFHPGETSRDKFLARCGELRDRGVAFSVGVVGLREHFDELAKLRDELPPRTYLWVNAFKDVADYYRPDEITWLETIDPHFATNNTRHASHGERCRTGENVVSIDGAGTIRRCHFVSQPLANFYEADFALALRPRLCPNRCCGCHIGYVHLEKLRQDEIYGPRILERVPLAYQEPLAIRIQRSTSSVP